MKIVERIVMVLIVLMLSGGGTWLYFSIKHEQQKVRQAVASGEYQIPNPTQKQTSLEISAPTTEAESESSAETEASQSNWREYYPTLVPIKIGETAVLASIADSLPERIKGLSSTPFLPEGVVKLFAFGAEGEHSIWMKDMNYSLDIIWVAKEGEIVHIEENVAPDTYPQSFSSLVPAYYVIEANAGFIASSSLSLGDEVSIAEIE